MSQCKKEAAPSGQKGEANLVDVGVGQQLGSVGLVLDEDAALQQALLLRRHHEVVCLVLQIANI